jgi:F-type H+-transporting ATPase subunit a
MLFIALSAELPFTAFLNRVFGGLATNLLEMLGIHPHHPGTPFTNWMAMQILVALILIALFALVRMRMSADNPGKLQHVFEFITDFVEGQSHEIIGHHYRNYTSFLIVIFLFVLAANLIGMIPGFESPTAHVAVPLGCAIVTWLVYHSQGFYHLRLHYLKQFVGPVWGLAWLMIPIEIVSHAARLLSLTVRLWANIFAGDMITLAFFSLIPVVVPVLFLGLHLGVSLIQAYIFLILATVYIGGAVSEEH